MQIKRWKPRKGQKNPSRDERGTLVRATRPEALKLIIGLLNQILADSPNSERAEFFADGPEGVEYFTMSVAEPEKKAVKDDYHPRPSFDKAGYQIDQRGKRVTSVVSIWQ